MSGPTLAPGNILTLRAWTTAGNQAAVNTFHYLVDTVGGIGVDLGDCAIEFDALVGPAIKTNIPSTASYNGVQAYVNQLPQPIPQTGALNAGPGSNGAALLARQTCGLTTWETPFTGPAFRGRTYWSFPPTGADAGTGIPTGAYQTSIQALNSAILTKLFFGTGGNVANVTLVLRHGKNKLGIIPPPTPLTSATVQPAWATQKRRGSYGRPNVSPV
jgi:hypothetical protein